MKFSTRKRPDSADSSTVGVDLSTEIQVDFARIEVDFAEIGSKNGQILDRLVNGWTIAFRALKPAAGAGFQDRDLGKLVYPSDRGFREGPSRNAAAGAGFQHADPLTTKPGREGRISAIIMIFYTNTVDYEHYTDHDL